MKITNKHGLPAQVVHWLTEFSRHNEDERAHSIAELEAVFGPHALRISATSLLKPTKEVILTDRHYDEMEKDATDIYDALIGTAIHESFRTMPIREHELREIRVGTTVKGVLVTGQFDYILDSQLGDYKSMKVGGFLFGDKEFEFNAQLSVNRYLFCADPRFGYSLKDRGKIIMLFTDWRKREYDTKKYGFSSTPDYPHRSVEMDIELWSMEDTEKFINKRVTDYKIALLNPDKELPSCTDKERWMRATKNRTTYAKCEQYCSVKPWCFQWRKDAI